MSGIKSNIKKELTKTIAGSSLYTLGRESHNALSKLVCSLEQKIKDLMLDEEELIDLMDARADGEERLKLAKKIIQARNNKFIKGD